MHIILIFEAAPRRVPRMPNSGFLSGPGEPCVRPSGHTRPPAPPMLAHWHAALCTTSHALTPTPCLSMLHIGPGMSVQPSGAAGARAAPGTCVLPPVLSPRHSSGFWYPALSFSASLPATRLVPRQPACFLDRAKMW
jgi:hypothetical protein